MRKRECVLIIDDDRASEAALRAPLEAAGLRVEVTNDNLVAIEKLKTEGHCAVVLDPMIRHRLNGYAVLSYIEFEQPAMMGRVFLSTAMPKATIVRTAPAFVPRLFRKPSETRELIAAVIASAAVRPRSERRTARSTALIVEDDSMTAEGICGVMNELGYSCEWAASGATALQSVSASKYDVVLLDLVMPDVDGFAFLQYLKVNKPDLVRRVVVITGMPSQYLDDLAQQSVCGVLRKPLDVPALQRLLDRCEARAMPEGGGEYAAMAPAPIRSKR
jgi:CheY-like chemotaxis protein